VEPARTPAAALSPTATCVLADRERTSLDELGRVLSAAGLAVIGSAGDGDEALRFVLELRPDVAVVDAKLPGRSGFEIARRLLRDDAETALVLRASAGENAMLIEAVELGARGYVLRESPPEVQVRAATAVVAGGTYFDGGLAGGPAGSEAATRAQLLTRREREILRLLADGLRIAEIGKHLYLSPDTIKVHLTKARRKLGARTTAEAVATAVRRSLIV
jgi:two-component system nitrate/nitrite response regulator NarL